MLISKIFFKNKNYYFKIFLEETYFEKQILIAIKLSNGLFSYSMPVLISICVVELTLQLT
jgi:hypothetical protein